MTTNNIARAIDSLFGKHRLVFWYDETGELKPEFEELASDNYTKVVIANDEFALKYRMLKEEPKRKFLIYRTGKRPDDLENWLLDLQLAHAELRIDKESTWLSDLGLGEEFRPIMTAHREFFVSTERRTRLQKALDRSNTEGDIKRKMLQICTGAKQPRIDSVLEQLLEELADESSTGEKLIQRCNLEGFLWEQAFGYYRYESSTPNIQDFAITLFKACLEMELNRPVSLKESAIGFLNRWKDNRHHKEAFETLSGRYSAALNVEKMVEAFDYRQLSEIDYFQIIDKKILSALVRDVQAQTISKDECSQIIRQRRMSHWFAEYKAAYEAIDYASQFLTALEELDLTPKNFDDGVKRYADHWYRVDLLYRKFIYSYRSFRRGDLLKTLYDTIEQKYSNSYLLNLSDNWQKIVDAQESWNSFGLDLQRNFFKKHVEPFLEKDKKVYVIISDAFRFEIGKELAQRLIQEDRYDAKVDPAVAQLPSYTQLGMAALLPHNSLAFVDDDSGRINADGQLASGTAGRDKIIKASGKAGKAIQHKDFMELGRDDSRDLLKQHDFLYIYHNQIDFVGDKRDSEERVFDAAETTIEEIIACIKRLAAANATNIIVTADHGFLYQNKPLEESDYLSVEVEGVDIRYHDRRFVLGKELASQSAFKKFSAKQLGLEGDFEAVIPKSINRLRKQGSGSRFVHGGATLQEIVIPVVRINKKRQSDTERVDVEILSGSTSNITSGQLSVTLYQQQPASDKRLSRTLEAGLWSKDGELISDSFEIIFDSASDSPRERETKRRFILTRKADEYNNQSVYLKLREKISGTSHYQDYRTATFTIKRSFTSDFDF